MGRDKSALDWHGVPLLAHICAVVRRGIGGGPVVIVRSAGQADPVCVPGWAAVVEDSKAGVGPMQGLLDGLKALPADCESVFLAGVDAPFLTCGFVRSTLDVLACAPDLDAAIPFVRGFRHPVLAGYRAAVVPDLAERLERGERRAGQIFDGRLRLVEAAELLAHPQLSRDDPGLSSVEDVDTPERFDLAIGRSLPEVSVERGGVRTSCLAVRLAGVSAATGLPVDRLSVVDDVLPAGDPLYPLGRGDIVIAG